MVLADSYLINDRLFALNLVWVAFLLVGMFVHRYRAGTLSRWFVLSLPYFCVDAVKAKVRC